MRAPSCLLVLPLVSGCAPAPATGEAAPEDASAVRPGPVAAPQPEPLRVLVTGFNDWKDLGDPPNLWRCRDNPSCRLLVGDPLVDAPAKFEGPLVPALHAAAGDRAIVWSFATLPVTWGVSTERTPYTEHDVVVHVGLGVYDRDDEVFVEAGAYNLRRGTDAAGKRAEEAIFESQPQVMEAPPKVAAAVQAVDGLVFGTMTARTMPARPQNTYLCNETHSLALDAVRRSQAEGGPLEAAFFVHIPQPAGEDWPALAESVAGVVLALVGDGAGDSSAD
ncbi:MAG: hypothetical protein ACRBN8_27485 [Nannocystales bacterium]